MADLLERLTPVGIAMQDSGIVFTIEVGTDIKEISADHDRLLQIFLNLLSNAMHHVGQEGDVSLSIHRDKTASNLPWRTMAPAFPPKIYLMYLNAFIGLMTSRNRHEGGVGLGLAIASGYVEAHQGKIWVESSVGSGTTFYFTLPQILSK